MEFSMFSNEIMLLMFSFCNVQDLKNLRLVSWNFNGVASDDSIWKPLCRESFNEKMLEFRMKNMKILRNVSHQKYFWLYAVHSFIETTPFFKNLGSLLEFHSKTEDRAIKILSDAEFLEYCQLVSQRDSNPAASQYIDIERECRLVNLSDMINQLHEATQLHKKFNKYLVCNNYSDLFKFDLITAGRLDKWIENSKETSTSDYSEEYVFMLENGIASKKQICKGIDIESRSILMKYMDVSNYQSIILNDWIQWKKASSNFILEVFHMIKEHQIFFVPYSKSLKSLFDCIKVSERLVQE